MAKREGEIEGEKEQWQDEPKETSETGNSQHIQAKRDGGDHQDMSGTGKKNVQIDRDEREQDRGG